MSPYDLIKAFFNEKEWNDISKIEKSKNFFIVNRVMSIMFPLQANALNNTKIDPVSVINYWKKTLTSRYKTLPGWVFTSSNKKEKDKKFIPKEEVSDFIKSKYEISTREISDLSEYYPKDFKKFCELIEEQIAG